MFIHQKLHLLECLQHYQLNTGLHIQKMNLISHFDIQKINPTKGNDKLHGSYNQNNFNIELNPISEMFYGTSRDQIVCSICGNTKLMYNVLESINFQFIKGKYKFKELFNKWKCWTRQSAENAVNCVYVFGILFGHIRIIFCVKL